MMKKRILCLALTLLLAMSLICIPASADSDTRCSNVPDGVSYVTDLDWKMSGNIVFFPDELLRSDEKYPVIVWANGTCCPTATYYELCGIIAGEGYIVVANTSLMAADGKDQIASIDYIISENSDPDSIFCDKVDCERIGAAGHSQGGRSAVNAASDDSRIKAVVSVAGSSFAKEAKGLRTPTFFVTGTADLVVLSSLWVKPAYNKVEGPAAYAALRHGIHTSCWFNPEAIAEYAVAWFDAYLCGDAEALSAFLPNGALANDSAWTDFACKNIA